MADLILGVIAIMVIIFFVYPTFDELDCEKQHDVYDCQWVLEPVVKEAESGRES